MKKTLEHAVWNMSEPFCVDYTSILLLAYSTATQSPLETDSFTGPCLQNNPVSEHMKTQKVCFVNSLLYKIKITMI